MFSTLNAALWCGVMLFRIRVGSSRSGLLTLTVVTAVVAVLASAFWWVRDVSVVPESR